MALQLIFIVFLQFRKGFSMQRCKVQIEHTVLLVQWFIFFLLFMMFTALDRDLHWPIERYWPSVYFFFMAIFTEQVICLWIPVLLTFSKKQQQQSHDVSSVQVPQTESAKLMLMGRTEEFQRVKTKILASTYYSRHLKNEAIIDKFVICLVNEKEFTKKYFNKSFQQVLARHNSDDQILKSLEERIIKERAISRQQALLKQQKGREQEERRREKQRQEHDDDTGDQSGDGDSNDGEASTNTHGHDGNDAPRNKHMHQIETSSVTEFEMEEISQQHALSEEEEDDDEQEKEEKEFDFGITDEMLQKAAEEYSNNNEPIRTMKIKLLITEVRNRLTVGSQRMNLRKLISPIASRCQYFPELGIVCIRIIFSFMCFIWRDTHISRTINHCCIGPPIHTHFNLLYFLNQSIDFRGNGTQQQFHSALLVGPFILEFNNSGLCIPRNCQLGSDNTILSADVATVHTAKDIAKVLDSITKFIMYVNANVDYVSTGGDCIHTMNCQDFVDTVLDRLQIQTTIHRQSPLGVFMRKLKTKGSCGLSFYPSNKAFAAKFQMDKKVKFSSHEELDRFVIHLETIDPMFRINHPDEYALLKAFDRAMWTKYSKSSDRTQKIVKEIEVLEWELKLANSERNQDLVRQTQQELDNKRQLVSNLQQRTRHLRPLNGEGEHSHCPFGDPSQTSSRLHTLSSR